MTTATSLQDATDTSTLAERITALVSDYEGKKKSEWWLLEPGDPFYEDYTAFDDITNGEGPTITNFVRYFAQDGTELYGIDWNTVKPKRLSDFDLKHFRSTPNEMLLGRDGTIIVSCGRWGRRQKPAADGHEYLPLDDYFEWRAEVMETEDRTVANRPAWAETVHPIPAWGCVDYIVKRGTASFQQRLESDGEMREGWGSISGSFTTIDQLRTIARDANELADLLDSPPRLLRRRPEVDHELQRLDA